MYSGVTQLVAPGPTRDFIRRAGDAGYQCVELALRQEGDLTIETAASELEGIRDVAADAGIELNSLVHGQCTGNLLATGDPQRQSIEQTRAGLRIAADLGIHCTLHTLGRLSPDLYYEDAYRHAVDALKELGEDAQRLGVEIAVEFVWTGFLFSPVEMKRFLQEIDCSAVGFYFDPGNMAVFQFPQHWVRALGPLTKRVHLKDWKGRALNGQWTALLAGDVDFATVMAELRNAGYDGALISEVEQNLASLEETASAIDRIISM